METVSKPSELERQQLNTSVRTDPRFTRQYDVTVQMFGDKSTLTEVCFLIAYIRDMIMSHQTGKITVEVGKHIKSDFFGFTVNGEPMANVTAENAININ